MAATLQDVVKRLTVVHTTPGADEAARKIRDVASAQREVANSSVSVERATSAQDAAVRNIAQRYVAAEQRLGALKSAIASNVAASDDLSVAFRSLGGTVATFGAGLLGYVAVSAAIGAMVRSAADAVEAYRKFQDQQITVQNILQATAGASGRTAEQIERLAKTFYDVNAARESAQALLQFSQVGGEVFERAMRVSENLAASGFGGMAQAANAVGRALQNPIEGIKTLGAVSQSLTYDQQKLIETLYNTGRTVEAQTVLLTLLEAKLGGAAEAQAGTLSGAIAEVSKQSQIMLENFGAVVIKMNGIVETTQALAGALQFLNSIDTGKIATFLGLLARTTTSMAFPASGGIAPLLKIFGSATAQGEAFGPGMEEKRSSDEMIAKQRELERAYRGVVDAINARIEAGGRSDAQNAIAKAQTDARVTAESAEGQEIARLVTQEYAERDARRQAEEAARRARQEAERADKLRQQRLITGEQSLAQAQLEIDLIGKGTAAQSEARANLQAYYQLKQDAARTNTQIDEAELARSRQANAELARQVQLRAQAQLRSDVNFERDTLFLSPTDQQIAGRMRQIFGDEWSSHMGDAEANTMRLNAAMRNLHQSTADFAATLIEGLARGDSMAKTLENALSSLSSQLIRMGTQSLAGSLFQGVNGAGQQTGGVLGGGLTSILGIGASLAGPVGGLLAIGGGLLAGLFGSSEAKKQQQQQLILQQQEEARRQAQEAQRISDQQAEAATNYRYQAASIGIDTQSYSGALAKLELDTQRGRAEAAKTGGAAIVAYEEYAQAQRYALEKQWAEKAAAAKLSYEDRIFAALNDNSTVAGKLAAYDRRAAQERADALKIYGQVYVELERAQAIERSKIISDAMREQTDYYTGLRKSIDTFTSGLQFSSLSTLSPAEQYLAARNQFLSQYDLAIHGDRAAQGGITSVAQTLLEQARSYLGPSLEYGSLVDRITQQLGALPDLAMAADPQVQELQRLGGDYFAPMTGYLAQIAGAFTGQLPAVPAMPVLTLSPAVSNDNGAVVSELRALRDETKGLRDELRAAQAYVARQIGNGADATNSVAQEIAGLRSDVRVGAAAASLRPIGIARA